MTHPQQRWPIRSALLPVCKIIAARDFQRIKDNFKTSHKRPPGPRADKDFSEHSKLNQNTGSQQFREF